MFRRIPLFLLGLFVLSLFGVGCQNKVKLIAGLVSDDPVLRRKSNAEFDALAPNKKEAYITLLCYKLRDQNHLVADRAAQVLIKIGEPAIENLTPLMTEQDAFVASLAIGIAGDIGPAAKDAIPTLIEASRHSHPLVREEVMAALRKIGVPNPEALQAIQMALKDDEKWVRNEAQMTLDSLQNKKTN